MKIRSINKKLLSALLIASISLTPILTNAETNKYSTSSIISNYSDETFIFSDHNISDNQYGANQTALDKGAKALLYDELIMEELEKYFPSSKFRSERDAEDFYIKYLALISNCGCGYAAAANAVFQAFDGKAKEFEETFGFPMYRLYGNDKIDYNYELFILKFFNFYNIDKLHRKDLLYYSIIDQEKEKIQELKELTGFTDVTPPDFKKWPREKRSEWLTESFERQREFEKLFNEWKKTYKKIDDDFYFGVPSENTFGYLREFLKKYKVQCSISFSYNVRSFNTGDIIAASNFDLYKLDSNGNVIEKLTSVESHYVYVIGKTLDGEIIVSSWGAKYIYDRSHGSNDAKIILKIKK